MSECILQGLSDFDPKVGTFVQTRVYENRPEATQRIECVDCRLNFTKVQTWKRERKSKNGHFSEMELTLAFAIAGPYSTQQCLLYK